MNKNLGWKLTIIIITVLLFLLGVFGVPKDWSGRGILTSMTNRIHLGLDLRGGTHLVLEVQINDAVNIDSDNAMALIKEDMRARKIDHADVTKIDPVNHPEIIVVRGVPPERTSDFMSIISERLPEYDAASGAENSWTVAMKAQSLADLKDHTVAQAIETIRKRIDQLGVSEPEIAPHGGPGKYQILVQLPDVDDPARVKAIVQSTAMLEFKQVLGGPYSSPQQAIQDQPNGLLGPDSILLPGAAGGQNGTESWYVVSRASAITGRDLRNAQPSQDSAGQPAVGFSLTGAGGRKFYAFTSGHVKDRLGVILDNKVQSAATIDEPIRDQGIIRGRFTLQEVQDQCMVLRSGALPASMKYLEERTVGPSLGADSIRSGVRAAIIGMLAVLIFMPVYYRWAGVNADVALILNLVILLGFMGYFGAVLTLPGIAGVILTVGMGVDSNVLIFERIREELRNGKTPPSAVEQGFSHAWITIVDTHVTTIVSAAILFLFGTGPVQGFATTLVFGLLANLFTAVFVSRVIFDWVLSRKRRGEALSI
jgi:preprotein translocase subunit SecD